MRRTLALGALVLIAGIHPTPAFAERCDDVAGEVVSVEGEVSVAGTSAVAGGTICSGETIEVGPRSRAAVRLEDTQTVVRIDQRSTFRIESSAADRSWLTLLRGVLYLFSRQPESLLIDTPHTSAAVDGTEFVVATASEVSEVTVIEGRVVVGNALGELRLAAGETAAAGTGDRPRRRVVVDPLDAVRWALHYPPIGASESTGEAVRAAARLLATGDVEPALARLATVAEDAVSLALRSMVAVTQNRPAEGLELAERAVDADAGSSVAYTALSYAHQARFDIDQALGSATVAAQNDPRNADALARLAELQLGVDDTAAALASASEAIRVEPGNSRAHAVLGFVRLLRLEIGRAEAAFAEAIARDPGDPLPRLGLGLAVIRDGRLAEGREQIEVAASLDPADALVRSYLGKAYAEERQPSDAAAQFELAQRLDPQDPTPWLYDALLEQALNRPGRAYEKIRRARALNDNTLVYQSRLLVDKSAAAGSLSLSRIYTDLGFEQPAINESTRSIALDPSDFSAYRFLADSYAGRERHEAARRSVLFQASLLQPLTLDPVQPYAQESDLLILPGTDPVDPSIREYSALFDREGFQLAGSLVAGGNGTFGDNLVLSGLHDRVSYSLGQFHYETDGFRGNADVEHDVYHGFVQGQVLPNLFVQADVTTSETAEGNFALNLGPDEPDSSRRVREEWTSSRLGLRAELGARSTLLLAGRTIERTEAVSEPQEPPFTLRGSREDGGHEAFVRFDTRSAEVVHTLGVDAHDLEQRRFVSLEGEPCLPDACPVLEDRTAGNAFANYYYYASFPTGTRSTWTLGLGYTDFDNTLTRVVRQQANPALGLRWRATPDDEIRFAASRGVTRGTGADLMLEPTVLAGFNQAFDDQGGTRSVDVGFAYDRRIDRATLSGAELFHRELDVPRPVVDVTTGERSVFDEAVREATLRGYWNRILRSDLSLGLELLYERSERVDPNETLELSPRPRREETFSLPFRVDYTHSSGFFARSEVSIVHQSIERVLSTDGEVNGETTAVIDDDGERFTNVDLSLGLRLPTRRATFRLDVRNLLDEDFLFLRSRIRSAEPESPRFSPERTFVGRVSFSFR